MGLRRSFKLKNEAVYTRDTWVEWTLGARVVGDSTGLELIANGVAGVLAELTTALKTSTKYGIIYNVITNDADMAYSQFDANNSYNTGVVNITSTGNTKLVFTTAATTTNKLQFYHPVNTSGKNVKLLDVRIFELPTGSQIEFDFTNLTADQLTQSYPWFYAYMGAGRIRGLQ